MPTIDLGGNDVIVNGLKVGATAPGQAGTSLASAELTLIHGLTAGTVTASKAVVVDANKDVSSFRNVVATNFDAGADAVAGTVDIFPTTTATGKIQIAAADSAGAFTTTITNASQAAARTYTIPDAGASASFVMTQGTQTLAGATTVTGAITPTGGVAAAGGFSSKPYNIHTGGVPAQVSTAGTDATPSVTETYYAHVFVPANTSVTGISTFNGSATGSGNISAYLVDSTGAQVAGALTASTAVSGTDAYQRIPFTPSAVTVKGPASYYVVTQYNNTATRFNTHTLGDFPAAKVTSTTYGTLPSISPAATFTTALGPIASLY